MIGVFILYLRDYKNAPLEFAEEFTKLSELIECIWCYEIYEEHKCLDDEITKLVFDLIEDKCSRSELWEVYYVRRSI